MAQSGILPTSFCSLRAARSIDINIFLLLELEDLEKTSEMYTEDQKKYIIQAFGRTTSPSEVRIDFLNHYKIKGGRTRSKYKIYHFIRIHQRNGKKVMLFVAIVDGKIPIVHPFIDEAGRPVSVNGSCYLSLLKNTVWPVFRSISTRRGLWWMQDGAPPHCTREAKEFLLDKFRGKVISRGTPINWPAHSPDLNPLDFHFWSEAQAEVYRKKPEDIESLIECVKTFAASYCSMTIRKVSTNVLKRAQLCVREQGGHFQHLLK